jgi:hypothetical protein
MVNQDTMMRLHAFYGTSKYDVEHSLVHMQRHMICEEVHSRSIEYRAIGDHFKR